MKPGDLVRINLPERCREFSSYYYHNYVGLVLDIVVHENPDLTNRTATFLVDGVDRAFSERYLEVVDEAR